MIFVKFALLFACILLTIAELNSISIMISPTTEPEASDKERFILAVGLSISWTAYIIFFIQ